MTCPKCGRAQGLLVVGLLWECGRQVPPPVGHHQPPRRCAAPRSPTAPPVTPTLPCPLRPLRLLPPPRRQVYAEKHRDAVYEVQAYKPVCAQPTDYDAGAALVAQQKPTSACASLEKASSFPACRALPLTARLPCSPPLPCPADGSTLRRMADSLMGFWRYCYGADGAGGAVAAATAAARGVLAQLASTPLPEDAAGGPWGQQLFSAHPDISASLLVQSFLKAQLNVRR